MSTYNEIKAYSGNKPYIFVSYAHKDSEVVLPIIEKLQKKGFRIWFDKGIEAGSEWPQYIAEHLNDSCCVLVFMSSNAAESHNCRREIHFAIELRKELLVVYLEKFEMDLGMRMQLNSLQAIHKDRFSSFDLFAEELSCAKIIQNCREIENIIKINADDETCSEKEKDSAIEIKENTEREITDFDVEELCNRGNECYKEGNFEQAVKWWSFSAEQGSANAQNNLGHCYHSGLGVARDFEMSVKWFKVSAEQGNDSAQYNLGCAYYYGEGIEQDYKEATKWFKLSAEQGNDSAQYMIGDCYYYGRGVKQDYNIAKKYFTLAAKNGHKGAEEMLKKHKLKFWVEGRKEEYVD